MQLLTDLTEIIGGASIGPSSVTATNQGVSVNLFNANIATGAIVEVGTITGTVTTANVQIEQWDGTTNTTWTAIANMVGVTFTASTRQVLLGLRTYQYVRGNLVTMTGTTTVSIPISVEILAMPKSSGSAVGYSNLPQNTTTQ